ncbi:MAG TPA: metallophosphoesterase [Spirochaetota bacterium]|nr:metallophosphoesterase [Spirochaetota bacterium]
MKTVAQRAACLLLCMLCAGCLPGVGIGHDKAGRDDYLRIWAHSDIQPRNPREKAQYEAAVADIVKNVPDIYASIVAGDLVHRKDDAPAYHEWLAGLRRDSGIPWWFEIAGNHDQNDIATYFRYTGKPLHYAVKIGNMLIILMSDEIRSAVTDISDEAFIWWRGLLRSNRHMIIVTVTHGALHGVGILSTINPTMRIGRSERFVEVLKKYPVDLWLSGHSHIPSILSGKYSKPPGLGTLFIDVSSIHKSRFSPMESYVIVFKTDSDRLQILLRDHERGRFIRTRSLVHSARAPFIWEGGDPKIISTCCAP